MQKRHVFVRALVLIGVLAIANQVSAWAVVAVNPAGSGFGYGFGASPNRNVARQLALRYCGPECRLVKEIRTGCVALADNLIGFSSGVGSNREAAERMAIRACESLTGSPCAIRQHACSSGGD